jgi:hypothetical protein
MTHASLAWASYCGNRAASLAGEKELTLREHKPSRPIGWPWRRRLKRVGATPEFAAAITRLEFGRYYPKDLGASSRAKPGRKKATPPEPKRPCEPPVKPHVRWRPPSIRERRSELEAGKARLLKKPKPDDDAC